jgi:hypothetical protein
MAYRDASLEGRVLEREHELERRLARIPRPTFRLFPRPGRLAPAYDATLGARPGWQATDEAARRYLEALDALLEALAAAECDVDGVRERATKLAPLPAPRLRHVRKRDRIALSWVGIGNLAATRRELGDLVLAAARSVAPDAALEGGHPREVYTRFEVGGAAYELRAHSGYARLFFPLERCELVLAGVMPALGNVHAWNDQGVARVTPSSLDGLADDADGVRPVLAPLMTRVADLRHVHIRSGTASVSWSAAAGAAPFAAALALLQALQALPPPRWALAIGRADPPPPEPA